jgi:hypothetical protein
MNRFFFLPFSFYLQCYSLLTAHRQLPPADCLLLFLCYFLTGQKVAKKPSRQLNSPSIVVPNYFPDPFSGTISGSNKNCRNIVRLPPDSFRNFFQSSILILSVLTADCLLTLCLFAVEPFSLFILISNLLSFSSLSSCRSEGPL